MSIDLKKTKAKATGEKSLAMICRDSVDATSFLSYRDFLQFLYQTAKAHRPSYSYLQFAAELGFSKTNVIRLVIVGSRPLTIRAGEKIAQALELKGDARRYWLALISYANERDSAEREKLFKNLVASRSAARPAALSEAQAEFFSNWRHAVVRELASFPDFSGDALWIKERLSFPLRLDEIKDSLELLERLGFLRRRPHSTKYEKVDLITTPREVDSLALIAFHQEMMELGRRSLIDIAEDRRDVRALTMSVSKMHVPLIKAKIEEFVGMLATLEQESEESDEVLQVNVQMFPFTKA